MIKFLIYYFYLCNASHHYKIISKNDAREKKSCHILKYLNKVLQLFKRGRFQFIKVFKYQFTKLDYLFSRLTLSLCQSQTNSATIINLLFLDRVQIKNINIINTFWISGLPKVFDMVTIGHKNRQPKHQLFHNQKSHNF